MSLYKTMRCRYFDENGKDVKPFCNQGSRCRYVLPFHNIIYIPNPDKSFCEKFKTNPKNKPTPSSSNPTPRGPRSSPLVSQHDLFKQNQGESEGERGRDHETKRDRRDRDPENWERHVRDDDDDRSRDARRYSRERQDENKRPQSSKRHKKVDKVVRSSNIDAGDNAEMSSSHSKDRQDALQMTPGNPSSKSSADKRRYIEVASEFSGRLAKLYSQLVQDSCQLDREEEKLKAFTELSSELSKTAPATAMAVTPALAAVIASHAKCKECVAARVKELDSLWENLFSIFMTNIVKATDINLENAIASLHKERDAALQSYSRSSGSLLLKRKTRDRLWDELDGPTESHIDGNVNKGARDDGHVPKALVQSPESKRRRVETPIATSYPIKEEGIDLKDLLETMKSSFVVHSRVLELLTKEKQLNASPEPDHCMPLITPARTAAIEVEASPLAKILCPNVNEALTSSV